MTPYLLGAIAGVLISIVVVKIIYWLECRRVIKKFNELTAQIEQLDKPIQINQKKKTCCGGHK